MIYYRLISAAHADTPLGYGNAAGRWNKSGTPLIYACNISALNFLEFLAIRGSVVAQNQWVLVTLQLSDQVPILEAEDLPSNWFERPYPYTTQEFGTHWAQGMYSVALTVPSCRIPLSSYPIEHNLLINPLHPDRTNRVKVRNVEPVDFAIN